MFLFFLFFRLGISVRNADEMFQTQSSFGLHMVMVYGDYKKQLVDLARSMNVEPVVVEY